MQEEKDGIHSETDYELALRLAGLSSIGKELVEKKATSTQQASPAPIKADVRVNTLNKPNSILKKWHVPSCAAISKEKVEKNTVSNAEMPPTKAGIAPGSRLKEGNPAAPKKTGSATPIKPEKNIIKATVNDYFFDDQPNDKSFNSVFEVPDSDDPLLPSKHRVNLDSLDDDILKDEFSKTL